MTTKLRISEDLALPLDAVTQAIGFLGRRGSGKTYAATKLAELMLSAHAQIVVLDPVGVWYGLRLGEVRYAIPVFGGLHGDIPLEPTGGALMADLIVDRGISAVLDVSQMILAEQTRFATDFATQFFQRKKAAPSAVHLFLEECQEFIPQNPQRGEERMLHAFQRIVKLGRNFGIGPSLISQRPQEVSKKALNQTELLFVFQTNGKHERTAIESWIADKGIDEDIGALLPKLEIGAPRVWSPQWLKVSKTISILPKGSLDASSTPKVGARAQAAKALSPIDLAELRDAMAATLERAKAEDPRELRRELAAARKQIADLQRAHPTAPPRVQKVEVPVLKGRERQAFEQVSAGIDKLGEIAKQVLLRIDSIDIGMTSAAQAAHAYNAAGGNGIAKVIGPRAIEVTRRVSGSLGPVLGMDPRVSRDGHGHPVETLKQRAARVGAGLGDRKINGGERRIMSALAQYGEMSADKLAIITRYTASGGGFRNYCGALRTAGLIEGADPVRITDLGRRALGPYEELPTGNALREHWLARGLLGKAERLILGVVCDAYPRPAPVDHVAAATGYEATGGGFRNAVGRLRTLDLISGSKELTANELLCG